MARPDRSDFDLDAPDQLGYTSVDYERFAAESRAAQGLPPKITDPEILGRLAALIRAMGDVS